MKKRLMVDMDDVMLYQTFPDIISEYLGEKITLDMAKGYYLQELLGDKKTEFFKGFKDINLYENTYPLDNCYEVMKSLNEKYELYICTSYIWRDAEDAGGTNLRYKYEYLMETFPFIKPSQYIFTTNKSIIDFDIRLDDSIHHLSGGEIKLLYTAYHNKNISDTLLQRDGIERADDWLDVKKLLLK